MEQQAELKDLADLSVTDIENILDHRVNLHHPNGVFNALVKKVHKFKKQEGVPGRDQPFSIIFECEPHPMPVQANVRIQHEKFGLANVLITPIQKDQEDKDNKNIYFEAVFG